MRFWKQQYAGVNIAVAGAVAVILASVAFAATAPAERSGDIRQAHAAQETRLTDEIKALNTKIAAEKQRSRSRTWSEGAEQIGADVLAKATSLARANKVKLTGFRPQRVALDGSLEGLPFVVTLEGSFANVFSMARALEAPGNRLAVSLCQVAAIDGASDRVAASIGVVAYRLPLEEASGG